MEDPTGQGSQANNQCNRRLGEGGWTSVIDVAGDSSIFLWFHKGKFIFPHDRGYHWVLAKQQEFVPVTNAAVNHIAFVDKNHGYVAQDKLLVEPATPMIYNVTIFGTTDGGKPWLR